MSFGAAIQHDINEYVRLCRKYDERPVADRYGVSPYGSHTKNLRAREQKELEKQQK